MSAQLGVWLVVAATLGTGLAVAAGLAPSGSSVSPLVRIDVGVLFASGLGLLLLAGVAIVMRRSAGTLLSATAEPHEGRQGRPYASLFLVSFVVLFVEVMLIRYCGAQLRVFAFFKNVPLIGCFLGLGLGCFLGGGRPRHALAFLLWMVPLAVFLSQGSQLVDGLLGGWAAAASTEHILGDAVARAPSTARIVGGQLLMGLFSVATLVAITLLFSLLGRFLGDALERVPRLAGYTANIVGSLAGILLFVGASYAQTPPAVWFLVGLAPLLWWLPGRAQRGVAVALIACSALAVVPSRGDTVWSPYQKLVGHQLEQGYLVQISDVFYQVAVDLRPGAPARANGNPFPHYDGAFADLGSLDRVLVVGAGTGNDVAAALRAGAQHVDAVDIDPAIVAMGRAHHPERPYDDPRVRVIVDDARAAFRKLPAGSYDAVVFGLLDSHTQLGMASVRLDNYVFTRESLAAARRLLRPGGAIVLTAATFYDWFRARFVGLLETTCGSPVRVRSFKTWFTFSCHVEGAAPPTDVAQLLPTDDWPFLYLPERAIPRAYLVVVGMLAIASVLVLRLGGLRAGRLTPHNGHMFFLGAAFLLVEVAAINRLALLFGTTWLVSAVTIALVLSLIVGANLVVALAPFDTRRLAYGALAVSLLVGYTVAPATVLGGGLAVRLAYGTLLLSPVFFAGMVFATSFRNAPAAAPALGANVLGSVLGGWVEYSTMVFGIGTMALVALVFYLCSLMCLLAAERRAPVGEAMQGA